MNSFERKIDDAVNSAIERSLVAHEIAFFDPSELVVQDFIDGGRIYSYRGCKLVRLNPPVTIDGKITVSVDVLD